MSSICGISPHWLSVREAGGPFQPDFGWSGNNHILTSPTGAPVYDAAGEITTGTSGNVYLYDAEGRICAVATAGMDGMGPSMTGYVYDAAGNRVAKGPITKWNCDPTQNGFETSGEESDYIHNPSGQPVTKLTMDEGVMTWNYTNVYANGQLFATYDAQGLHFDLDDWLGTRRVTTDYAGVVEQTCASLPYGDQLTCTGSQDAPNEQHFTAKTHDTESGLDYFGARYYNENDARFMSPDTPFYDGNFADPQSLNLYSYVGNNPLTNIDPNGHDYRVCPTGGQCVTLTNQQYEDAINGKGNDGINAPAFGQSGNITCSGQVCGYAQYFDQGEAQSLTASDLMGIAGGMAIGKLVDAAVGTIAGWFGRETGNAAGDTAGNAAAGTVKTFQDIWDAATPVPSTSKVATREMTGGFTQAQKDFDSLPGTAVKAGRVWVKELPNGEGRAILRDFSSPATGNRPTLELQPAGGGFKGEAIRYNP